MEFSLLPDEASEARSGEALAPLDLLSASAAFNLAAPTETDDCNLANASSCGAVIMAQVLLSTAFDEEEPSDDQFLAYNAWSRGRWGRAREPALSPASPPTLSCATKNAFELNNPA